MTGIELIAAERQRQVEVEGWTPEHDDEHANGEMLQAAIAYANEPKFGQFVTDFRAFLFPKSWHPSWWKPSPENRVRELVKAGSLIAAEIDRLQRKETT